jgi:putative SOS response-associated peptidase YedK
MRNAKKSIAPFFLHLKNFALILFATLWVKARFFIINALVKISMFTTKADGH